MPREERQGKQLPPALVRIFDDIRSLNSSILIISQKIKYIVRNEKILGRNLVVLNKKLQAMEDRIAEGRIGGQGILSSGQVDELLEKIEETNKRLASVEAELSDIRASMASKEQLQEMKYVIDSINPLEYVTVDQAKEMMGEKKGKKKR